MHEEEWDDIYELYRTLCVDENDVASMSFLKFLKLTHKSPKELKHVDWSSIDNNDVWID